MPSAKMCHIVAAAYEAWGHTRPLCALVAAIAKERPFVVTLFTPSRFYHRALAELSRNFNDDEFDIRDRIRVIGLKAYEGENFDIASFDASFAEAYSLLVQRKSIMCIGSGTEVSSPDITPDAALIDLFGSAMMRAVREYSTKPVKVFTWVSCNATAFWLLSGGFGLNKDGKLRQRIEEEAAKSGKSFDEAVREMFDSVNGNVIPVPGIPPLYDWELFPQEHSIEIPGGDFALTPLELFHASDGVIFSAPACLEPPEIIQEYMKRDEERGSKAYWFGPLLPLGEKAMAAEAQQSAHSSEIKEFLDLMLKTHGPDSVLYVSFGSLFWPTDQSKIWTFLETLLDQGRPFLMSHASRAAKIPDEFRKKVKASGIGYLSPWSPQQTVLHHAAVGWFVTHTGFNSTVESIVAGVPMICWPFHADQPINTLLITKIDIGYELLAVRSGNGLKTLHRIGQPPRAALADVREEAIRILESAYGADGKAKRQNILKLRDSFVSAWEENGESRMAIRSFLDSL